MTSESVKTILYVEDSLFNLYLVKAAFAARPLRRILTATLGNIGLESARQDRPDLILLDMRLPDMTGLEFLQYLRAEPALAAIPVIVVTGDQASDLPPELPGLGVTDIVIKPFDVDAFEALVERRLAG